MTSRHCMASVKLLYLTQQYYVVGFDHCLNVEFCVFFCLHYKRIKQHFFCVFQKQIHNIPTKLCKTSYSALLPSLNWRWKDNDGFLGAEGRTSQRNLLTTFLANHVLMSGLCPDYDDWRMAGSISIISRAQIIRPNRKNSPRSLNVVKSGLLPLYFWW